MTDLKKMQEHFAHFHFLLDEELIHILNKCDQTGQINNVIIGLNKECYGLRLFEEDDGTVLIEVYYINYKSRLSGNLVRIELDNPDYSNILFVFCKILATEYSEINEIHAFNTFQKQLRTVLEKDGFFTITTIDIEELKKIGPNGALINVHHKAIKKIDLIPIVDFYREIFNDNYKRASENYNSYVYLMINTDTSLIKIGYSKDPIYREKTLHSKEPQIYLIACWNANRQVETQLHRKFRQYRIRGEYFKLSLDNLRELKDTMEIYN